MTETMERSPLPWERQAVVRRWRLRATTLATVVALLGGVVGVASVIHDATPAEAASCPSGSTTESGTLVRQGHTICNGSSAANYYSASALVCVAGAGKYKNFQYPSLRTCEDAYLQQRESATVLSGHQHLFYKVDLYSHMRIDQNVRDLIGIIGNQYLVTFNYFGITAGAAYCTVQAAAFDGLASFVVGQGCSQAFMLAQLYWGL